jgi:hypothetical protein
VGDEDRAISQTLGSFGDEIGRMLAQNLSYEFAGREIILQAAERFGEGVAGLYHLTEERPRLWQRVAQTQRHYRVYVETIIWAMAARDNVVLVGRGSVFHPAEGPARPPRQDYRVGARASPAGTPGGRAGRRCGP